MTAIPDLWDDKSRRRSTSPAFCSIARTCSGSDLRITNFGGGNTSAKVDDDRSAHRARTETVLWVKGSGGDLGSMKLDGFSTLYLDKLHALEGLYRGLAHEDEMVDYLPIAPSISIRAPLRSTRRCMASCRTRMSTTCMPTRSSPSPRRRIRRRLTREIFGDEMGYLPWQRPGFDLGLKLGEMADDNPHFVGVVLGGHGLFTWGRLRKECYRDDACASSTRRRDWLEEHAAQAGLRRRALREPRRRPSARGGAARLMPEIRGRISKDERKIGHFTDAPEVLEFVNSQGARRAGAARHLLPRSFPAHQDQAAGRCRSIRATDLDALIAASTERSRPIATTTRPITSAASSRTRPRCAIPMRSSIWCRASACCPSPRTRRRRASRPNSTSTPSMSCAAPQASSTMSACPSRKPSTSNTGCSRKPSCSACRSPRASPAASPSSPAAPAASARRSRIGC